MLLLELLLRRLRQVVERFALLVIQKEARCVQVLLDLLNADHFRDGFVMENDLVLALSVEVTDLGILNTLDVV